MDKSLIQIFRGDDTDGLGYQSIQGKITTTLDLTGCRAVFRYLGFTQEFDPIPENGRITITMPASATSKFPPGLGYASLRVYDSEGKVRTFTNRIPVFVTVYAPSECGGEFEVVFNGGNLELEPLKIKSVNGYRIYDGYLEQIIDKATAIEYGLALLFDRGDSAKDANSGYAATPKAVQAAYDAIIGELTDNYYNAEETEEAIDRIAAYYITSDAQGNPFATYAELAGATEFYSGGQLRTPTRNDYCVVLADETHGGEQYRYIYSVNQQGIGQWEAQYAVGGSIELDNTVTRTSGNGVKSSGIWSAIWGALTAVPGFSSLYDWCVAQLAGKASTADATLTPIYSDTPTFSEWTFSPQADIDLQYNGPSIGWIAIAPEWDDYAEVEGPEDATELSFTGWDGIDYTATRTRTDIIGYTLGSQSDKPLQPKGDYALKSELPSVPVTSVNGKTGDVVLNAQDVGAATAEQGARADGALQRSGGTMTGLLTADTINFGIHDISGRTGALSIYNTLTKRLLVIPEADLIIDYLARMSDIYAAIQQIAPVFTAKAYALNELCTYNGVVYRCKSVYTATASSPKPDSDTTHWETKKVSELFAPLASPAFTGTPTAPTPASGDDSTKVATTEFVQAAVAGGGGGTPLSGQTFDFATTQGVMDALQIVIETLGGTVVNAPSLTISQGE